MVAEALVVVAAITSGLLAAGLALDAVSQRDGDQFIYAQGGYTLLSVGLLAAIAVALVLATGLARLPRGTEAFRWALAHVVTGDLSLLMLAGVWFTRRDMPLSPVSRGVLALLGSAVGLHVASVLAASASRRLAASAAGLPTAPERPSEATPLVSGSADASVGQTGPVGEPRVTESAAPGDGAVAQS